MKLLEIMEEMKIKKVDIAKAIDITRCSLNRKLKGDTEWNLREIIAATDFINELGSKHIDGYRKKTIDEIFR